MKKLIAIMTLAIATLSAGVAFADMVRGYVKNNGTYVAPYNRSPADGNPYNNYGSK